MLNLDSYLKLDAETIGAPNLCDKFKDEDLAKIGAYVSEGYKADKQSRQQWETRTEAAMKLALQIQEEKTFPWPGSSNVKFPLITIATMQFHARAYPALVSGPKVVKCRVIKDDPDGKLAARAKRLSTHMSWQVLEEDQPWEEQHDRLLINLPIVGTAFKKSYFSNSKGHNVSETVLAKDLVLNYYAKSVEDCPRKTHVVPFFRNDIHERVRRGQFRDVLEDSWFTGKPINQSNVQQTNVDNRQGSQPPPPNETTPFVGLEQHCLLDLDNDGYEEPYIVTIEEESKAVLRLVCRFEEQDVEKTDKDEVIKIKGTEYFTKYPFIPSPDGGIYDVGFGVLLGPLNESVNTLINQLIDAGTMATTAGGFLGRGVKVRGGNYSFAPLEWKRVDSTGDDLNKNIVPLPVREPSNVLLQLLTLLVQYTNRISSSTDALAGENPGQNTPAYNQQSMIEEGMRIYTALFKRVWRAMKEEFKKLYILNGLYLPEESSYGPDAALAYREDYLYDPQDIAPAADPSAISDQQRLQMATMVKQAAATSAGYDRDAVELMFLEAAGVPNIDQIFGGSQKFPPPQDPKIQVEMLKQQIAQAKIEKSHLQFVLKLSSDAQLIQAKIDNLKAQASLFMAQGAGEQAGALIQAFEAQISALEGQQQHTREMTQMMLEDKNAGQDRDAAAAEPATEGA